MSDLTYMQQRIARAENGCWLWTGSIEGNGYGRAIFARAGRSVQVPAHKAMYAAMVAPIPDGHVLHHKCETKACVNPDHLEPLTRAEHALHHSGATEDSCSKGHPLADAYVRTRPNGSVKRSCRQCGLANFRAWYDRGRVS